MVFLRNVDPWNKAGIVSYISYEYPVPTLNFILVIRNDNISTISQRFIQLLDILSLKVNTKIIFLLTPYESSTNSCQSTLSTQRNDTAWCYNCNYEVVCGA